MSSAGAGDREQGFRVHRVHGWRRLLLWPAGRLLAWWGRSWRMEIAPDDLARLQRSGQPVVIVLWHNRLLITAEMRRRFRGGRPLYGLVSASRDGAWLAAFFAVMGIRSVRGSSSRGGREAVHALTAVLRGGHDIGITPDGPRGPRYDFKGGAVLVARRAQAPLLLLGVEFEAARTLRSWDGFRVPRPFSRVRVRTALISAAELTGDASEVNRRLAGELRRLNRDKWSESR